MEPGLAHELDRRIGAIEARLARFFQKRQGKVDDRASASEPSGFQPIPQAVIVTGVAAVTNWTVVDITAYVPMNARSIVAYVFMRETSGTTATVRVRQSASSNGLDLVTARASFAQVTNGSQVEIPIEFARFEYQTTGTPNLFSIEIQGYNI